MACYLIAGATGYVGSRLTLRLLARGHRVRALTRNPDGAAAQSLASAGAVIWRGDVTRAESLVGIAEGVDYVYNLTSASVLDEALLRATLVGGNQHLIAACTRARGVRGYLFASNLSPYGDPGGDPVDEDSPISPVSPLGHITAEAEQTIVRLVQAHRFPAIILRVASIYGPGRDLVEAIEAGTAIIYGSGKNFVPHIHIADLLDTLERAATDGQPGAIYNVADDEPARLIDLHGAIRQELGMVPPRTFSSAVALQSGINPSVIAQATASLRVSNARMKHDLGVSLRYPSYSDWLAERLGAAELALAVSA